MQDLVLFPSLYEDDYITRSLGPIVSQPDVALTELVANAWDAGASHVTIMIPENIDNLMYIEDDGIGMTEEEFQNRWMKLRYNRLKEQGKEVVFPYTSQTKRCAFGRNGVGRHGLFCFGNQYKVITRKDGKQLSLTVKPNIDKQPFAVTEKVCENTNLHGTRLEVIVTKNLPNVDKIREIISARFLQDPQFQIEVNHITLQLEDLFGGATPQILEIPNSNIKLTAYFIDSTKSGRKSVFQGIAFWQSGRLVGEPSWVLGNNLILDDRTSYAKRYTIIIKTEDLSDYIKEDWSGFKNCDTIKLVYEKVEEYVNSCLQSISSQTVQTVTENLDSSVKIAINKLNPLAKRQIHTVIRKIVENNPKVKQESIDIAVAAVINIENSQNGKELLEKLASLSSEDVAGLNQLLNEWTIGDALVVLNEIDRRLTIIEAIRKLACETTTDELHILHPMIAESRWLFGPEYESSEYTFNRQMKTVVGNIFGNESFLPKDFNNKKRPDLVCLNDSTISVSGLSDYTGDSGLPQVRNLLIIELKRGGFKIDRKERNQTTEYVEAMLNSQLGRDIQIQAFVVGDSISDSITTKMTVGSHDQGKIYITTYDQLVDLAERRLFGLRQQLASRYDDVPGMELYRQFKFQL